MNPVAAHSSQIETLIRAGMGTQTSSILTNSIACVRRTHDLHYAAHTSGLKSQYPVTQQTNGKYLG